MSRRQEMFERWLSTYGAPERNGFSDDRDRKDDRRLSTSSAPEQNGVNNDCDRKTAQSILNRQPSDPGYLYSKYLAGLSDSSDNQPDDNQPVDNQPTNNQLSDNQPVENPLWDTNDFALRRRTLDIAILNNTSGTLRFVEEYFSCGSWCVSPKPVNIPPGQISIAYVASRKPSLFGVNGAIMYELVGKGRFLYIGFDNPVLGRYKTFIRLDSDRQSAEWACELTETDSVKNFYVDDYQLMGVIRPPKQSKFRLFRYTIEEDQQD